MYIHFLVAFLASPLSYESNNLRAQRGVNSKETLNSPQRVDIRLQNAKEKKIFSLPY